MRPRLFRDKRDRVRQLRIFCEVVRAGSISGASERLGLTQPAVSLQVRDLEHDLGATLLERRSTGVQATPAGRQLFALTEPLVQGVDGIFENLPHSLEQAHAGGGVRVAVSHAGAAFVLPRFVRQFRDRHPDTRVDLVIVQQREALKLLLDGSADLVCGPKESYPDALHYEELLTYGLVLITPPDHPLAGRGRVSPAEAAPYGAIVPASGTFSRQFGESTARANGVDVNRRIEVGGWSEVKRYVETGLGISVIPSLCLKPNDRLAVAELDLELPRYSYGTFVQRNQLLAPNARAFFELLAPNAPDDIFPNTT